MSVSLSAEDDLEETFDVAVAGDFEAFLMPSGPPALTSTVTADTELFRFSNAAERSQSFHGSPLAHHVLDCHVSRQYDQVGPGYRLAVFLLDRPEGVVAGIERILNNLRM